MGFPSLSQPRSTTLPCVEELLVLMERLFLSRLFREQNHSSLESTLTQPLLRPPPQLASILTTHRCPASELGLGYSKNKTNNFLDTLARTMKMTEKIQPTIENTSNSYL